MLCMRVKVNVLHEDQELVGMRRGGVRRMGLMCTTGSQAGLTILSLIRMQILAAPINQEELRLAQLLEAELI